MTPLRSGWEALKRAVRYYVFLFIEGDHSWGGVRLMGSLLVIGSFVALGRLFEAVPPIEWFRATVAASDLQTPTVRMVEFFISFVTPQVFRHAVAPTFGVLLAMYMGALYLRDLMELPNVSQAYEHLSTTLFGGNYPHMTITEGRVVVADGETNPLPKIGGPGWVDVRLGSAALFERVAGPSSVRGAGLHFIHRFESLREALDLREMERSKNNVQVFTKDGLPLALDDVRVRFRLRTRGARSAETPFPVLPSAIRQAVYSRRVNDKGLESWPDMVLGAAVGVITGWIARRRMDDLIPPPTEQDADAPEPQSRTNPPYRQALHNLFLQNSTRQRFADMGAEILWVAVGHLHPDPDVDPDLALSEDPKGRDSIHGQMVETWKSQYQAMVREEMAHAQGYAEWMEETARAQAQVEMIQSITRGLKEALDSGVPIADLITARSLEYVESARPSLAKPSDKDKSLLKLLEEPTNKPSEKK